jgi:type IV pilus assembly protein PilQ
MSPVRAHHAGGVVSLEESKMVASPLLTTRSKRRRGSRFAIATALVIASLLSRDAAEAAKPLARVTAIESRDDGASSIVTIKGTSTPTFTVYKLEKPERVVVDVANARLDADVDGPVVVNGWAVTQVAAQALGERDAALVRVIVGFARPSSYRVQAVGNDVVVTVTAREAPPAVAGGARVEQAQRDADAAKADAARARAEADRAKKDAEASEARLAREKAETERRRAETERKRAELDREKAEIERKNADLARRDAELAQKQSELDRKKAEAEAQKAAADARQAEIDAARAEVEADRVAARKAREDAERRRAEAEAQKIEADKRARQADEARRLAEKRAKEADSLKADAERRRAEAEREKLEADRRRAEVEKEKLEADRRRAEVEKAKLEADRRRAEADARAEEAARQAADAAKQAAEAAKRIDEADRRTARADERMREAEEASKRAIEARREAERLVGAAEARRKAAEQAQKEADTRRAAAEVEAKKAAERAREAEAAGAADAAKRRQEAERAAAQAETRRREAEAATAEAEARRREADGRRQLAETRRREAESASSEADARRREAESASSEADARRRDAELAVRNADAERKRAEQARDEAKRQQLAAEKAREDAIAARRREEERARDVAARRVEDEERARAAQAARTREEEAGRRAEEARRAAEKQVADAASALKRVEESRRAAEAERLAAERRDADAALAERKKALGVDEERAKEIAAARDRARSEADGARRAADAAKKAREEEERRRQVVAQALAEEERRLAEAKTRRKAEEARLAEAVARVEELKKASTPTTTVAKTTPAKATPAKATPAKTTPAKKVRVKDVDFVDREEHARVVLALTGAAEPQIVASSGRQAILAIPGAELPAELERALDTRDFEGPVTSVSSFRDPRDPSRVRVVVDLAEPVEQKLVRDGDTWYWDFEKPAALAAKTRSKANRTATLPRTTSYAPPVVGGYGAASTPVTAQTVAQRRKVYRGSRVQLDLKDADIHNVLRFLADHGDVDIVVPDDIKGTVTIRLRNVPWDQALDVILKSKGLGVRPEGRIYRVAFQKDLDAEDEAERQRRRARVQEETPETEVFTLNYGNAAKLLEQVKPLLSPKGKVQVDERTNALVITDIRGNREAIIRLMRRLDTQTPQVQIEARIVEARSTFARELGVQWGTLGRIGQATGNATGLIWPSTINVAGGATDQQTPTEGIVGADPNFAVNLPATVGLGSGGALGFTFGSVGGNFNLTLRLSAAEETGVVRIVSAPKVTVLSNLSAEIKQGISIPISQVSAQGVQTIFVEANLSLKVTPRVSQRDCSIILDTEIEKNEADFVNTGARGDPTILTKEAKTTMLIADGETTVIGGIYTRNTGLSYSKVPYLAEIPIIGFFFRNRRENDERTEMLIFITPKITNRALLPCESPRRR